MIPQRSMNIGTFNVRGMRGKEHLIDAGRADGNIAVAVLTETWITPPDEVEGIVSEYTALPSPYTNGKGYGGGALCVHPLLRYTVLKKHSTPEYQFILIRVQGVVIMGLYISPSATARVTRECFSDIEQCTSGPTVVIGDLNAKHRDWSRNENTRGRFIKKWAIQEGWTVNAPLGDTFTPPPSSGSSPSTIDLAVLKGLRSEVAHIPEGVWDGCSDHMPIVVKVHNQWVPAPAVTRDRISYRMRIKPEILRKAQELYTTQLIKQRRG